MTILTVRYPKKIPVFSQAVSLFYFLFFLINSSCFAQDYLPFKGIIHVHTNISEGVYLPSQVLNFAQEKGIKIVIFTDSFLRRWEYGVWPLRNIIKIKEEEPSLVEYGIRKYLKEMDNLNSQFPGMVILGGTEVAPFYWWKGDLYRRKAFNFGWGKHLLVVGLSHKDYAYLPVISKRHILPQNLKDFISIIIPLLIIFLGSALLISPFRFLGYAVIILGIVFLINSFPFSSKYDAYHGDKRYKPYQEFIDYVRLKGGFVSWAHPATECSQSLGKVDIITLKYPDVLTNTFNYNAFADSFSREESFCFSHRQWDVILKEFCLNKRENPVWVIGEIDYHGRGQGKIDAIQTVFFLTQLNRNSVFDALKKGRFYARTYKDNFYIDLEKFSLEENVMGEIAQIKNNPKLIIKGDAHIGPEDKVRLEIIRDGEIIKTYEIIRGNFALEFIDDSFKEIAKKTYYRLNFLAGGHLILISNPIFCVVK